MQLIFLPHIHHYQLNQINWDCYWRSILCDVITLFANQITLFTVQLCSVVIQFDFDMIVLKVCFPLVIDKICRVTVYLGTVHYLCG